MKVKKRNRSFEKFNPDKIISSCVKAGAPSALASGVAQNVSSTITPDTTTEDIRQAVYEILKKEDPKIAKRYIYRYRMKIRTSKTTLENFQIGKIVKSLMNETDLDRKHSKKIAREVEKELGRLQLDYVTAPLIREIVNVKLLENGFESTRARYTRLGMPVHDVMELIDKGSGKSGLQHNPETVQKLMADQISREYTLLNVLPPHLADAHMSAQIHIHRLDYFSTRPFSFSHDLRFFLKNGFRADGIGKYSAISGPPKKPEVAFLQAAKILGASQTSCSGGQALNFFNVFLAPYITGLDIDEIQQLAQIFVYELSQNYSTQGLFSSICCTVDVPEQLKDVRAVIPGGKRGDTYGDFSDESKILFGALLDAYLEGDFTGKQFDFPKLEIHLGKKAFKDDLITEKIGNLVEKSRLPYFSIERPYLPKAVCYQNCSFLMPIGRKFKSDLSNGTLRGGCVQIVSLNLPQMAHESKGSEKRLSNLLGERMEKAMAVLLLKKSILEKNLPNLHPFFNQKVGKRAYMNPWEQALLIGFVGLEDSVEILTEKNLAEKDGGRLGKKIVRMMGRNVEKFRKDSGLNFELAETPECPWIERFSQMNGQRFKKDVNGYENSYHTGKELPALKKAKLEGEYHPLLRGGATLEIPLDGNPIKTIKKIALRTETQHFKFI